MHQFISRHHVLSLKVTNTLQLHVAFFCRRQQAFATPEYLSSSSNSRPLPDQSFGDFLRLASQLQEQKKALNKKAILIFVSNVATAWRCSAASLCLSLLPIVTWQIGSLPRYYSVSVRNLIEFTSRIHFS